MRILMVASEAAPYAKTGGLADVIGSLPGALAARGEDVAVVLPLYRSAQAHLSSAGWVYDRMHIRLSAKYDYYAGIRRLYVCVSNDNYTTDATATLSVTALVQTCK